MIKVRADQSVTFNVIPKNNNNLGDHSRVADFPVSFFF